jgi:hypothetical protein
VRLADDVFFFKRLIREAALRHDCFATFMAKPIAGEPGSAMHIHTRSWTSRRKNIFADPKGGDRGLPDFIGGLKNLGAAVALFAPYVNSYRRYVPTSRSDQPRMGPRQPHHGPAHADLRPAARRWKTACRAWTATPISASPPRWPAAIWA